MKNESAYQRSLIKQFKDAGAMVLNIHGNIYQSQGWPDLYIAHRICSGFLEIKHQHGGWQNALQRHRVRDLRDRNILCFVARWLNGHEFLEDEDFQVVGELRGGGANKLKMLALYWKVDRANKDND